MGWDDAASEEVELRRSRSKSRRRRSAEAPAAADEADEPAPSRRSLDAPAEDEVSLPVARSRSRRHRGEALQALAAEEAAPTRAPSPPTHATHTRLFIADLEAVPQLAVRCVRECAKHAACADPRHAGTQALERAARPDVLFVRIEARTKGADVVAVVAAAHRAAGSPLLRSAALWLAGVPEEVESEEMRDDDEPAGATACRMPPAPAARFREPAPPLANVACCADARCRAESEARAQEVRKALRLCRRVVKGIAPLLAPAGRLHVLTPGLLPSGPTHLAEDEAETAADLQAAADGRTVAVGRGVPLRLDEYVLLSPDGEAVNIDAAFFNVRQLKMWRFARNRHVSVKLTGVDPHRRKVAGIEDAGDVQQTAITYLKEIPMLYSIMVGCVPAS